MSIPAKSLVSTLVRNRKSTGVDDHIRCVEIGTVLHRLIDRSYQLAFNIAYRLHLIWTFIFRPESHGVWVAIWFNGELLLIKNTYRNTLTLPGGGLGRGETTAIAAARELREEVGIRTQPKDLLFWGQYLSRVEYKHDHIDVFELELTHYPEFRLDNREVSWGGIYSPEQALTMNLFPALRTYLEDKRAGLKGPGTNNLTSAGR